jgi:hypothetical protein
MRRVAPSVLAREQLQRLLGGGVGQEGNIVSALVEAVTRLVVQELLEGEQGDFLGGRGRYEHRSDDQLGCATATGGAGCVLPKASSTWQFRRYAVRVSRSGRG